MLSVYAKLSSHLLAFRERATDARDCAYLIKVENNSHHKTLSHPMPEHVDDLTSLVRKKQLQQSFLRAITHAVACGSSVVLFGLRI